MKKNLIISAVTVAAFIFAAGFTGGESFKTFAGKPAPNFAMKTLEGKTLNNKNLKGKVVLLDFWATWCGPCKMAAPSLQSLHKDFSKRGLTVIGANAFERGDSAGANAKAYRSEHKYTYAMTYGNDKLAKEWGITSIPTFILIGRDGKVVKTYQGFNKETEKNMRKEIERLIQSK